MRGTRRRPIRCRCEFICQSGRTTALCLCRQPCATDRSRRGTRRCRTTGILQMSTWLDGFPLKPVIIAELGGKYASMNIMKDLVRAAKACGADMVKFQTFRAATVATPGSWFTFEDGSRVPQYEWF